MDILTSSLLEHFNRLIESLKCGLCNLKLVDPVRIKTCGHYFCFKCLNASRNLHNCPKCQEFFEVKHLDRNNIAKECEQELADLEMLLVASNKDEFENTIIYEGNQFQVVFTSAQVKLNARGETPLHLACKKNKIEETRQLVESMFDVNAKDYAGWAPLHEAIQSGSVSIVEYLLKQKCLVNIPGPDYTTPLHQAASLNHTQIVKLLLSYGANKELTDFNGLKPEDCTSNKAVKDVLKAQNSPEGHIFKVFLPEKVVVYCHSVDEEMKRKLEVCNHIELVNKTDINKTKLTHFVIKKSHILSFKIMQAMLDGLQFINEDLVDSFLKKEYFINIPKQTFITNDLLNKGIQRAMMSALLKLPKLFDGVNFYIEDHTKFVEVYHLQVDKECLKMLIRSGGGRVLNRAPTPTVSSAKSHPFFASKSSEVYHCCNFIIFNNNNPPGLMYRMKELKHKSSKWLIDCIVKYEITD